MAGDQEEEEEDDDDSRLRHTCMNSRLCIYIRRCEKRFVTRKRYFSASRLDLGVLNAIVYCIRVRGGGGGNVEGVIEAHANTPKMNGEKIKKEKKNLKFKKDFIVKNLPNDKSTEFIRSSL